MSHLFTNIVYLTIYGATLMTYFSYHFDSIRKCIIIYRDYIPRPISMLWSHLHYHSSFDLLVYLECRNDVNHRSLLLSLDVLFQKFTILSLFYIQVIYFILSIGEEIQILSPLFGIYLIFSFPPLPILVCWSAPLVGSHKITLMIASKINFPVVGLL